MQKLILSLLIAIFFPLILIKPVQAATTYYVSTSGNDNNAGTQAAPWQTIQKAANTIVAGDTVLVQAGIYTEIVNETTSGSDQNNMISYKANGAVTLKGFNLSGNYISIEGFTVTPTACGSWSGAINVTGNYCVIKNNIVKDSTLQGIVTNSTSTGCIITGNTITRANVNGILIVGTNHLVENNDISDIRDTIGSCYLWNDANGIEFHGSGNTFRGNYIHDFYKANLAGSPHVDAFQTHAAGKPTAKNSVIERNRIFMGNTSTGMIEEAVSGSQGFHGFMLEGTASDPCDNLTIRNNIVASWSGQNVGGGGNVTNLKIYNNIFRSSLNISASYWPTGVCMGNATVTGYEIFNNIFVDFSYADIIIKGGATGSADYNLFWNSNGTNPRFEGYTIGPHDQNKVDPKFVANFTNFHLQSTSPAINAGITLSSVANDYDGVARPQGTGFDIGAFEYTTGILPSPSPVVSSAPTPACRADLNGDKTINLADITQILGKWGQNCSGCKEDPVVDGVINLADLQFILSLWGQKCQ
jgi:hypothetical protein